MAYYSNNFQPMQGSYQQPYNNYNYNQMQPNYSQAQMPAQQPANSNPMVIWMDGEASAKSFQVPPNFPPNQPFPLYDVDGEHIYVKSIDVFGRPLPMRKGRIVFDDVEMSKNLMSGSTGPIEQDMNQYVTKSDLDELKNEIRKMVTNNPQQFQNRNNKEQGGKQ